MKYDKYNRLPAGAISLESIDKIHLTRLLEEGGADDLIPVLHSFSLGQILEEQEKFKDAAKLYRETLKKNPKNPWIKEAARRVKYTLN